MNQTVRHAKKTQEQFVDIVRENPVYFMQRYVRQSADNTDKTTDNETESSRKSLSITDEGIWHGSSESS